MLTAGFKTFIAVQLHEHSSEVTERTPANTRHLTKSLFMINALAIGVATLTVAFLYLHNGTLAVPIWISGLLFAIMHFSFV
jgi:VIT1/CCC1 family predicted Fe2+/Mn2+ transporter